MDALRDDGVPAWLAEQIYAPFIIAGPATWSNSWGAPRYGPGSLVRTHEGQDVLCEMGTPVLAAAVGEVHFDVGLLGGLSAMVYKPEGGALYYAHLSGRNAELNEGDLVVPGQVLGYCGETGNATVPHVHFGWIGADGSSRDPMGFLVASLRSAEFRFRYLHQARRAASPLEPLVATQLPYAVDPSIASRLSLGSSATPAGAAQNMSPTLLLTSTGSRAAGDPGLAILIAAGLTTVALAGRRWTIRVATTAATRHEQRRSE